MGALLKFAGVQAVSRLQENPSEFLVKLGRFLYSTTSGIIIVAWYSSWRNERVAEGDYSNWPLPGLTKLTRQYGPDRPNPSTPVPFSGNLGVANSPSPVTGNSSEQGKGVMFDNKVIAGWIAPILRYARAHGWRGTVTSGYRSYSAQAGLYHGGAGGRPVAKPGTSNHESLTYPGGAVDVTNAAQLSSVLEHSPYKGVLVWAGNKDPVHFSHPHDGGY